MTANAEWGLPLPNKQNALWNVTNKKKQTANYNNSAIGPLGNTSNPENSSEQQDVSQGVCSTNPTPSRRLRKDILISFGINSPKRSNLKKTGGLSRPKTINCLRGIEVELPGEVRMTRNTSITFSDTVDIQRVTSISDLARNPKDLWFQYDEFEKIRNKSIELARRADSPTDSKKYCVRGLETLMPSKRDDILCQQTIALDTVLDVQDTQRHCGVFNEDHIAKLYKSLSIPSQIKALERAQEDAFAIQRYAKK